MNTSLTHARNPRAGMARFDLASTEPGATVETFASGELSCTTAPMVSGGTRL